MSEVVADPDLKQEGPSPGQKRKRGGESPSERRTKRGAAAAVPAANMASSDSLNHAFLESAAAQATANVDLSALQQANEAANHTDATDPVSASSTAAAALGSMYPTMQVPTSTEQQFAEGSNTQDSSQDASFADVSQVAAQSETANTSGANIPPTGAMMVTNGTPQPAQQQQQQQQQGRSDFQFRKPAVGTDEWHKQRKDNHKEVERRRRETINEGINELAKIVPNCEKNKGSILQKAVQYIQQMKANESSNIEKWTLEKLLTEQAIAELTAANDKLKAECEQAYQKIELYQKSCKAHGIDVDTSAIDGTESSAAS